MKNKKYKELLVHAAGRRIWRGVRWLARLNPGKADTPTLTTRTQFVNNSAILLCNTEQPCIGVV